MEQWEEVSKRPEKRPEKRSATGKHPAGLVATDQLWAMGFLAVGAYLTGIGLGSFYGGLGGDVRLPAVLGSLVFLSLAYAAWQGYGCSGCGYRIGDDDAG